LYTPEFEPRSRLPLLTLPPSLARMLVANPSPWPRFDRFELARRTCASCARAIKDPDGPCPNCSLRGFQRLASAGPFVARRNLLGLCNAECSNSVRLLSANVQIGFVVARAPLLLLPRLGRRPLKGLRSTRSARWLRKSARLNGDATRACLTDDETVSLVGCWGSLSALRLRGGDFQATDRMRTQRSFSDSNAPLDVYQRHASVAQLVEHGRAPATGVVLDVDGANLGQHTPIGPFAHAERPPAR
jgi:hypothetical protein